MTTALRAVRSARSGGSSARQAAARRWGILFTLPTIALIVLLVAVPLVQSAYFSFTNWDGAAAEWVGIQNYRSFFTNPAISRVFLNSLVILASLPLGMVLPFVTAYLLSLGFRGSALLRTLIFAPTVLSWVVIGLVARSFFALDGPINSVLTAVGAGGLATNWLANGTAALIAVLLTFNAAVYGINTIILLAGLSTVDVSTIEAARMDGGSAFVVLWRVILPAIRRHVEFVFIITMVTSFSGLFSLVYVMTAGGPGSDTATLDFAVWQVAFASGDFGQAAALGIILMALILAVIGVVRLVARSGDDA